MMAEHTDKKRNIEIGSSLISVRLKRGQLAVSERFLAERWAWGKTMVRNFLKRLTKEGSIETNSEQGITVITICNYETYNHRELKKKSKKDQQKNHHETTKRPNLSNSNKCNKYGSIPPSRRGKASEPYTCVRHWARRYHDKTGHKFIEEKRALGIFKSIVDNLALPRDSSTSEHIKDVIDIFFEDDYCSNHISLPLLKNKFSELQAKLKSPKIKALATRGRSVPEGM